MPFNSFESRIAKLEQLRSRTVNPDSTIFVREIASDEWQVFNPESTGRIKTMTSAQLENRPRDHGFLFLMADGGIFFEEPE